MNDILIQVNILRKDNDENLYHFILEQLNRESKDIELWLGLAVAIAESPFGDEETGIAFVHKALAVDNNNPLALIILAYMYEYHLGGIDDMLLHQIKNLQTGSDEINSMLKYVASWSYRSDKKNDPKMEEKLLKESIALYDKHVWNYEHLATLYLQQERYLEVNNLIRKALSNVKKIYTDKNLDEYRSTNVYDFIDSIIKGTCITSACVEIIQEKLIPNHIIVFYMIITPFLNFYRWIRKVFLHSGNSD
jgi:tetratricopeptide (TPR) repeat protein